MWPSLIWAVSITFFLFLSFLALGLPGDQDSPLVHSLEVTEEVKERDPPSECDRRCARKPLTPIQLTSSPAARAWAPAVIIFLCLWAWPSPVICTLPPRVFCRERDPRRGGLGASGDQLCPCTLPCFQGPCLRVAGTEIAPWPEAPLWGSVSVDTLWAPEDVVCISVFHSRWVLSPSTDAARTHACFQAASSSQSSCWNQTGPAAAQ